MRFTVNKISANHIRLGSLTDFHRWPGRILETPLLLMYTKGGSIPHITHEVLQYITQENLSLLYSLPSTIQCFEALKNFKNGMSKFSGLEEHLSFCSAQDPAVFTPEGYNTKKEISVWSRFGKELVTPDKYMDIMEAYVPDVYETISDSDTNLTSSSKRCRKSVEVSKIMFDACLKRHFNSGVLKKSAILANLSGGYDLKSRLEGAKHAAASDVNGFVISGLHNNGPSTEEIKFQDLEQIITEILKCLDDRIRYLPGAWTPQNILHLMSLGIDMFDSSYVFIVTERKAALIFKYQSLPMEVAENEIPPGKMEIFLGNEEYKEDLTPIMKDCSCLTCRKHTRAYIHHLIKTSELLASTLLMIHNLHHYIEYFKFIRNASQEDKKIILYI